MKANFLIIVLTFLLGVTLGCMLALTYLQQLVLGHSIGPRSVTGDRMVGREFMSVVSVNEHFRTNGPTRLGCVCGQDAARLKDAARTLLERTSQQPIGNADQKEIEVLRSALTSSSSVPSTTATTSSPLSSTVSADQPEGVSATGNPHKCSVDGAGLLVAILTSAERINRSVMAFETWGVDMSQVVMFLGKDANLGHTELQGLPFVLLEDSEDHTERTVPKKLFKALKYLHQHFSNQYSWFMLTSGDVYVHGKQLEEFLSHLNPNRKLYIGHPASGREKDSQRLKLLPHEQYCMGGPGIVLSKAALQALAPHLDWCLEVVQKHNQDSSEPQWYNKDVELGRCISRAISVQCSTKIDKVKSLFYEDYAKDTQIPSALWGNQVLSSALTIHPVISAEHMNALHHFFKTVDYHALIAQAQALRDTINGLCSQLPPSFAPPDLASCNITLNGVGASKVCPGAGVVESVQRTFYPRNRYHIAAWEYFDPQFLYVDQMDYPSYKLRLHRRYHHELQRILLEMVKTANLGFPRGKFKLKRIVNGYARHDYLHGNEYILDGLFQEMGKPDNVIHKRIHLQRLLATNYVAQPTKSDNSETVHFIVPISNVGKRIAEYMHMYEEMSLVTSENTHLVWVAYGLDDLHSITSLVALYEQKYPRARLTVVEGSGDFSRAKAMELGMSKLQDNDLVFFCDVDMVVEREFLTRCRRNTIRGKQVYYPEFFKLYNMDYAYWNSDKPKTISINRQNGHWAYYSYGMVCIYKSDYVTVGGFNTGITGWGDEDVELYEKILRKSIGVFRAPDVGLTHRWHPKTCIQNQSTPKQYKHCLSSQAENLADRKELAQYILQQERLQQERLQQEKLQQERLQQERQQQNLQHIEVLEPDL